MRTNTHLLSFVTLILGSLVTSGIGAPPPGYYSSGDKLVGASLKKALHDIVDDHIVIPYSQTDEVMRVIDGSLVDMDEIELLYSDFTMPKDGIGASGKDVWNREHVWPRSFGIGSRGPDNSDLHNLYPCNAAVNSSRGNKFFDISDPSGSRNPISPQNSTDGDSWEPSDFDKGRIARAILYTAVRYDGSDPETADLELSDTPEPSDALMGKLSTILNWNRKFPPPDAERARNDALFSGVQTTAGFLKQGNRNPFTDYPQLADAIFLPPGISTWNKWQVESFPIAQLNQPASSGPLGDPDQDGFVNLLEFVGGSEADEHENRPLIDVVLAAC